MIFDDLFPEDGAEADIERYLKTLRDKFGVDNVAYAGSNPVSGRVFGLNTYNDDWVQHYMARGYFRTDPTLVKARNSIAPVDWSRLERDKHFNQVFGEARQFGIADQGLTIPVRGPLGDIGGFSVSTSLSEREWGLLKREIIGHLQSVAVHLHDTIMKQDPLVHTLVHPNLSSREMETLQWIAAGKSQQDIADILSISQRTVEVHLRSARVKLNALTTAQAIGRAIGLGLIYPE